MNGFSEKGLGWFPDHTDIRDLTAESIKVKDFLTKAGVDERQSKPTNLVP